ncbi:hypothetical protein BDV28DRAFT_84429 [Aspergillus coremiiformis]|uniref:Uncharacterized protein n=1 Tax=Aspergillus coremiiformis TaxID=138285 RepID=A0A5N6YY64_9EURO|nr:hypothetical protein BDV28DRAFT_84429 [Aspergillus coremiiformis]
MHSSESISEMTESLSTTKKRKKKKMKERNGNFFFVYLPSVNTMNVPARLFFHSIYTLFCFVVYCSLQVPLFTS